MEKPHRKIQVVGQWRPELDLKRFADALIALALHRLRQTTPLAQPSPARKLDKEAL